MTRILLEGLAGQAVVPRIVSGAPGPGGVAPCHVVGESEQPPGSRPGSSVVASHVMGSRSRQLHAIYSPVRRSPVSGEGGRAGQTL